MARQTYSRFVNGLDKSPYLDTGRRDYFETLENVHLDESYALVRRKPFRRYSSRLAGTFGLAYADGFFNVFGTLAPPVGLEPIFRYNQLPLPPSGAAMTRLLDLKRVDGLFYVVAEFADGSVHHYYAGNRVTDWDTISATASSLASVAQVLGLKINQGASGVSATVAGSTITLSGAQGVNYTVTATATNGGVDNTQAATVLLIQAQTAATPEQRAVGSFAITSMSGADAVTNITVNGVGVVGSSTVYQGAINDTAAVIAAKINANTSVPDYTAASAGNTVYIIAAAGTGTGPNGFVVAATVTGGTAYAATNMANGVAAAPGLPRVVNVTLSGTFEPPDIFSIFINGVEYQARGASSGVGRRILYFKNSLYSPVNSLVYKTAINKFTQWASGNEAGFISAENYSSFPGGVYGLEKFQGKLGLWSEKNIQLWDADQTLAAFKYYDSVEGFGTIWPDTLVPFGGLDVFFLDKSGIRSLNTLENRVAPAVSDIGVLIGELVRAQIRNIAANLLQDSFGLIEPEQKRLWMVVDQTIYVLTNLPGKDVKGWSTYTLDFHPIAGTVAPVIGKTQETVYLRTTDSMYIYGGATGLETPTAGEVVATVQPKFISGDDQVFKYALRAFDLAAVNVWDCSVLVDLDNLTLFTTAGKLHGNTYRKGLNSLASPQVTAFAPKLVCDAAGEASISSFTVYYGNAKEKDSN